MADDETRQWFADSTLPYALGVIALFEHVRYSTARLDFGPLETKAMMDGGLVVSGSREALEEAARVLAAIPGLVEYRPD